MVSLHFPYRNITQYISIRTLESCWVVHFSPERSERRGALHLNLPFSLTRFFLFFQLGWKKKIQLGWKKWSQPLLVV